MKGDEKQEKYNLNEKLYMSSQELKVIPEGIGLKEAAILERMGSQSELHLGARSVLFIRGSLVWIGCMFC